jgi:flagellar hook-basal body complex protein FliE
MTIFRPELVNFNSLKNVPLTITHPYHMVPNFESVLNQGNIISEMGDKIGTEAVTRSGTFEETMLAALDKVSGYQQLASNMVQDAITNPDMYDAHDISIAQAEASMALNITRNILNRVVQGWRDLINTR